MREGGGPGPLGTAQQPVTSRVSRCLCMRTTSFLSWERCCRRRARKTTSQVARFRPEGRDRGARTGSCYGPRRRRGARLSSRYLGGWRARERSRGRRGTGTSRSRAPDRVGRGEDVAVAHPGSELGRVRADRRVGRSAGLVACSPSGPQRCLGRSAGERAGAASQRGRTRTRTLGVDQGPAVVERGIDERGAEELRETLLHPFEWVSLLARPLSPTSCAPRLTMARSGRSRPNVARKWSQATSRTGLVSLRYLGFGVSQIPREHRQLAFPPILPSTPSRLTALARSVPCFDQFGRLGPPPKLRRARHPVNPSTTSTYAV
jgi:hypothetical protein